MKWLLRGLAAIVVLSVGYGVLANYVPRARIAAICVPAEVLGINLSLIPLNRADWGYLKLRSGKAGLDALHDLEIHGATDKIRQASVAVQDQWLEAGHVTEGGHLFAEVVQDKETRFSQLFLPLDGRTLQRELLPGQQIPESFWQSQRYRLGCNIPPPQESTDRSDSCLIRMVDMTTDNRPEIVVDHTIVETLDGVKTTRENWVIYTQVGDAWRREARIWFCDVPTPRFSAAKIEGSAMDVVSIDGQAMVFFATDCYPDNSTRDPARQANRAARMANAVEGIPEIYSGHKIPQSLIDAFQQRAVVAGNLNRPDSLSRDDSLNSGPIFSGLPPCVVSVDPNGCVAIVTDINHDGVDDVIIVDREVQKDALDYRIATLLMYRDKHWQIMSNLALCAPDNEDISQAKITVSNGKWRSVSYGGRLYTADDPESNCNFHGLRL